MAFTLNRRLAQLIDSNGQLNTGKIPNDYITSDHIADNSITTAMLHTGFTLPTSSLTSIDTDNVTEGSSNLYYTNARADARIAAATTDDLTEGSSNLYYTTARWDTKMAAADTDDLSEGSTNLYYTDARVATYISGNRDYGNITTTGYIAGPATFTIDPAAVGDNTGTVVIAGNLQVDGTTTTINSTTLTVDDKLVTLASGSANAGAANGAGIEVDISGATNPSLTYDGTNDEWDFNKDINVTGTITASGNITGTLATAAQPNITSVGTLTALTGGTGDLNWDSGTLFVDSSANMIGIGTTSPNGKLAISNSGAEGFEFSPGVTNFGVANTNYIASYDRSASTYRDISFDMGGAESSSIRFKGGSGNVGIGTASPSAKLELMATRSSGANATALILHDNVTGSQTTGFGTRIEGRSNNNNAVSAIGFEAFGGTNNDTAISFYTQSTAGGLTRRMIVDDEGKVGIGTTTPDLTLHIDGTNAYPATSGTTPNGMLHLRAKTAGGSHGLYMGVANASPWGSWLQAADANNLATEYPLLLNPNGGNVGIGTNTPGTTLDILTSTANTNGVVRIQNNMDNNFEALRLHSLGNFDAQMSFLAQGTSTYWGAFGIDYSDAGKFKLQTDNLFDAGSNLMTWDRNGNVGIGTDSPVNYGSGSQGLTINGTGNYQNLNLQVGGTTQFTMYTNGVSGTFLNQVTADPMMFYTSDTERMRIDSSGNLLVGKTTGASSTAGHRFNPNGSQESTASGTQPLYLNRLSSDGNIIVFDKDNSTVGQIGTYGNAFYIGGGTGSNSSGLMFNGVDIEPTTGSTGRTDAAIDLGSSNYRFQHVRFSGGLYGGSELQLSRVGIGTGAGSSIAVNSSNTEGIHWHSGTGDYYIGRTAGAWSGPNYQQLKIDWDVGVVIDGGTDYGKSGVHLKGPVASSNGGMVLQTIEAYNSTPISTSGSGVTVVSTTITVLNSSKVAVWFNSGQVLSPNNASNPNFNIEWVNSGGTSTVISDQNSNHYWYDIGKNSGARVFMQGQAISGALSAGTYTIRVVGNVYNGSATWNYQNQGAHLLIQEISKAL